VGSQGRSVERGCRDTTVECHGSHMAIECVPLPQGGSDTEATTVRWHDRGICRCDRSKCGATLERCQVLGIDLHSHHQVRATAKATCAFITKCIASMQYTHDQGLADTCQEDVDIINSLSLSHCASQCLSDVGESQSLIGVHCLTHAILHTPLTTPHKYKSKLLPARLLHVQAITSCWHLPQW
jgi:hypothetical protein